MLRRRVACDLHCFGAEEDDPLRFAPANLAAMKAFQMPSSVPLRETAPVNSGGSTFFGFLLRERIPSAEVSAATFEIQKEPAADASPGKSSAPVFTSAPAEKESVGDSKTSAIARQESNPDAAEGSHARAVFTHIVPHAQQPADTLNLSAEDTVSPVETESVMVPEVPRPLSADPVPTMQAAAPEIASATNSRPEASSAILMSAPLAASRLQERATPGGAEEREKPFDRASEPRDRKSEAAGKLHTVKAGPLASVPIHAAGSPDSGLSAATVTPAASSEAPAAPSPGLPVAAASTHGNFPGSKPDPRNRSSSLPQPAPLSDPRSAAGTLPDHTHDVPGAVPPGAGDQRTPIHHSQTASVVAAQLRTPEGRPPGEPSPTDGQHARTQTGQAPAPVAATQTAPSPQVGGLTSSALLAHPSAASSDASLRPAGALERMDAAAPPRVLESSPQNLAVGIRDAGLGWIEIRTHSIAGQVSATLATGTHEAHAAIAAELPAIRDTLMNQHVALHSLSAERFPASSGGGGSASDTPNSGSAARHSSMKQEGDNLSAYNEAEGEDLSYISVRV
jgi:hypothetical protein